MLLEEIDSSYVFASDDLGEVANLQTLVIIGWNLVFQLNYHQFTTKFRHFVTIRNLNSPLKQKTELVLEINFQHQQK